MVSSLSTWALAQGQHSAASIPILPPYVWQEELGLEPGLALYPDPELTEPTYFSRHPEGKGPHAGRYLDHPACPAITQTTVSGHSASKRNHTQANGPLLNSPQAEEENLKTLELNGNKSSNTYGMWPEMLPLTRD